LLLPGFEPDTDLKCERLDHFAHFKRFAHFARYALYDSSPLAWVKDANDLFFLMHLPYFGGQLIPNFAEFWREHGHPKT
jgi:hypothetical protein